MTVTVTEARTRFFELIRAAERGETVTVTRDGEPVARNGPIKRHRKIQWGAMRGPVEFRPGWDAPVDLDNFLAGGL
jgi:prevent-host-death family protein